MRVPRSAPIGSAVMAMDGTVVVQICVIVETNALVILDQNLVDLTGGGPVHLYPLLLMRRGMKPGSMYYDLHGHHCCIFITTLARRVVIQGVPADLGTLIRSDIQTDPSIQDKATPRKH
jgi:hypothetical protein